MPIDINHYLSKNKREIISRIEYSRVIESLIYLMSCTRLNITFTTSRFSRSTKVLTVRNYGLQYTRYPKEIEWYSDANWISDISDSKATSGYVFTLGGDVVS